MQKKVIVVSSIPFSYSNRGIDILTQAFAEDGYETTHLAFAPKRFLKKVQNVGEPNSQIKQDILILGAVSYNETLLGKAPKFVAEYINNHSIKSISYDFSSYDIVVLESGKPALLLPLISDHQFLIYRQSDYMTTLFKNPAMHKLEIDVMRRSDHVICVSEVAKKRIEQYVPKERISCIVNGFDAGVCLDLDQQYGKVAENKKNAIYVGYTRLDTDLVAQLAKLHPSVCLHIVGDCVDRSGRKKLAKYANIVLHGNLPSRDYLPLVRSADLAFVPYAQDVPLGGIGMHSKFLLFMYNKLPIVSKSVGQMHEFPESDALAFCDSREEFIAAFDRLIGNSNPCNYDIDFQFYSKSGRVDAYKKLFKDMEKEIDQKIST